MKSLLFSLLFFTSPILFAQAEIELEFKVYEYGQILQFSDPKREMVCTNIGDSNLIVSTVKSSGGFMAYLTSREPILPGESRVIKLHYDTKRIGPFNRSMTISSNSKRHPRIVGRVKGEVIFQPSTVEAENATIDIGQIPYGHISKATFKLNNSGNKNLMFNSLFSNYNYVEGDIFTERIYSTSRVDKSTKYRNPGFAVGETFNAEVSIRNIYGNTGAFERRLPYRYNSYDTLWLTVKGTFVGSPNVDVVYEKHEALHYAHGRIFKRIMYGRQAAIVRIDYFEGSNCIKSERYNGQSGKMNQFRRYKNGVEIYKEFFKVEE